MKRLYCDLKKCQRCRRCEFACYLKNAGTDDLFAAVALAEKPVKNIDLLQVRDAALPLNCRQCDDPRCVAACISGALVIDEANGRVALDPDKCVGCWSCIMRCPHGAIKMSRGIASKCDHCAGRTVAACVDACPTGALTLE